MKINMKNTEDKAPSGGVLPSSINNQNCNNSTGNPRIRIAVYGQHEVGKSGNLTFFY